MGLCVRKQYPTLLPSGLFVPKKHANLVLNGLQRTLVTWTKHPEVDEDNRTYVRVQLAHRATTIAGGYRVGWNAPPCSGRCCVSCRQRTSLQGRCYVAYRATSARGKNREFVVKTGGKGGCHLVYKQGSLSKAMVCQQKSNVTALSGEAASFIPGYECNSPVVPSDFDRLISGCRLFVPGYEWRQATSTALYRDTAIYIPGHE